MKSALFTAMNLVVLSLLIAPGSAMAAFEYKAKVFDCSKDPSFARARDHVVAICDQIIEGNVRGGAEQTLTIANFILDRQEIQHCDKTTNAMRTGFGSYRFYQIPLARQNGFLNSSALYARELATSKESETSIEIQDRTNQSDNKIVFDKIAGRVEGRYREAGLFGIKSTKVHVILKCHLPEIPVTPWVVY